jgi:hypothetical protein
VIRTPRSCWPIAAALSIASLTACQRPDEPPPRVVTKIERVVVQHPEPLLQCQDEPPAPPSPRTVAQGLAWVAEVRAAGADCRAALRCIRERQAGRSCLR